MLFTHLRRGLLVGALGGIAYGLFTLLVTAPLVSYAESLEAGGHGHQEAVEPAVAETTTVAVSVGGGILWGIFLGVLGFGVAYYFLEPAIPGTRGTKSYLLGGAGFITVSGAPWLVLPPYPPGVEQALPTSTRVLWYVLMVVAGALVCGAAGYLYHHFSDQRGRLQAGLAACSPFLILIGVAVVAPENTTHSALPPQFIAAYQGTVGVSQAGLWFVFASLHAWVMHRMEPASEPDVPADLSQPLNT